MKIQIFIEFLFKRKKIKLPKIIWEGTNREEVSKDQHHSLNKNKNLAKEKEVFFLRGRFSGKF